MAQGMNMTNKWEIDPNEDLVTPERLAKGDLQVARNLRGKISRAIPADLTIAKELVRRGIFPYHYEIYGVGFLELQAAFRAPWAAKKMMGAMEQLGGGNLSGSQVDAMYEHVARELGQEKVYIVQYVIEQNKNKEDTGSHELYRKCFEALIEAMDEERESAHAQKKK